MERYPCKFVVVMLGVLAWASLLVAASATAADINNEPVNAVCDWSVYGDNTNANYDYSSALLVGSDTGGNWTSVIKFDISSLASAYPPSHWDLDDANLKIRCDELDLGSTVDLAVGALVTAQTCSSDWNDYINSNYWPGGSETVTSGNCTGNWLTFSSGDLTIMFRNMWTGGWSSDDVALWPSPWWPGAYAEFYPENSSSEPYFEVDLNCDDDDGDGYADEGCGSAYGDDCNDLYSNINPGAVEVCGNGVDEDCSGADLVCPVYDGDGDGYEGPSGDGSDCNPVVFTK